MINIKFFLGICPTCKDNCHKEHYIEKFLENHEVDWGCCYCASKGFCK